MATLTEATLFSGVDEQDLAAGPEPDIEPDSKWKNDTRREIEAELRPMVNKAKAKRDAGLEQVPLDDPLREEIMRKYEHAVGNLRRIAEEQYQILLARERQERKFTMGKLSGNELEAFVRQQQEILNALQKPEERQRSDSDASGAPPNRRRIDAELLGGDTQERSPSARSRETDRERQGPPANSPAMSYGSQPRSGISVLLSPEVQGSSSRTTRPESEWGGVSRKPSSASLSTRATPEIWRPSTSPDDRPTVSRTFAHATAAPEGGAGDTARGLARAGSIRSEPRSSRLGDGDTVASSLRERTGMDSVEEESTSRNRTREKDREQYPQMRPRLSSSDFNSRRFDDRTSNLRSTPSGLSQQPQTPDSGVAFHSHYPGGGEYFPPAADRVGIPIRTPSRTPSTHQGSPENFRYPQPSISASRPVVPKQSFTHDSEYRSAQPSPSSKAFPLAQGMPTNSSISKPIVNQRSFTLDDSRNFQPSPSIRGWSGAENPPSNGRRGSAGSSSPRSQPSGQDFHSRSNQRPLYPYPEQSVEDPDEFSSDEEYGLENLEIREEAQRMAEEAERLIKEAREKEKETKRKEDELKRREADLRRREEDARRKETEMKRREEETERKAGEAERKEEFAKQRADDLTVREQQVRRQVDDASRREEAAKRKEEENKRKDEEFERKGLELQRLERRLKDVEVQLRVQENELRKREEDVKLKAEQHELQRQEELQRREELRRWEDKLRQGELRLQDDARQQEARRQGEARQREEVQRQEAIRQQEEARLREDTRQREALRQQEEIRLREEQRRQEEARQQEVLRRQEEAQRQARAQQQQEDLRQQEVLRQEEAQRQAELQAQETATGAADAAVPPIQQDEVPLEELVDGDNEAFIREQEVLLRHFAERKRQGSMSSDNSRPTGSGQWPSTTSSTMPSSTFPSVPSTMPSASSSTPRNIPGRSGSISSSGSGDRSSTTSSSFSSSSGFSYSGRSSASTYTQASTGTASSTTTATPKSNPGGWKTSNGTPAATSTSSKKSPTTATPSTFAAQDEQEWSRRQKEHARKQQEQFQRMQEAAERERQAKTTKQLSKEEVIKVFEDHERRWARLASMDILSWFAFPWPMLKVPDSPEDLTVFGIDAYVLSPHSPSDKAKSAKDRIKEHIKRWHPDRFETKFLPKVREEDREKVKEGAGVVARNLNELLTRQSNINDFFA